MAQDETIFTLQVLAADVTQPLDTHIGDVL